MSYFLGGFKTSSASIDAFHKILASTVPDRARSSPIRVESGPSHLISYGTDKVIKDVVIREQKNGSWLALIGTPLMILDSDRKQQELLAEFLANPADSLKENIDGNFAAFCYDAVNDRFIVSSDFNTTIPILQHNI